MGDVDRSDMEDEPIPASLGDEVVSDGEGSEGRLEISRRISGMRRGRDRGRRRTTTI